VFIGKVHSGGLNVRSWPPNFIDIGNRRIAGSYHSLDSMLRCRFFC